MVLGKRIKKGFKLTADGKWHELTIRPSEIAGGEHWGGADDGKWHGSPREFVISLPEWRRRTRQATRPAIGQNSGRNRCQSSFSLRRFKQDFEADTLDKNWQLVGDVAMTVKRYQSSHSLRFARPVNDAEKPCRVTSPEFSVTPGQWEIRAVQKAELNSPDNSYNAVLHLECHDGAGKVLETITVSDAFGKQDWQAIQDSAPAVRGADQDEAGKHRGQGHR